MHNHQPEYDPHEEPASKRQHLPHQPNLPQPQQTPGLNSMPYQVFPGIYMPMPPQSQQPQQPLPPSAPLPSMVPPMMMQYNSYMHPQYNAYAPPQTNQYGGYGYGMHQPMSAQQQLHMQWKPQSYSSYMQAGKQQQDSYGNKPREDADDDSEAPEVGSSKMKATLPKHNNKRAQQHNPKHQQPQASNNKKQPPQQKPREPSNKKQKTIPEALSDSDGSDDDLDDEERQCGIAGTNIVLDTPEDIQQWIAERKKNWPTTKRMAEKQQLQQLQQQNHAASRTAPMKGRAPRLPNHRVRNVQGVAVAIPERFAPSQHGGRSLGGLLVEGDHFAHANKEIISVLEKLAAAEQFADWETVLGKCQLR